MAVVRHDSMTVADRSWEHFPHAADVGVRGYGPSVAVAFEQAALAMTAAITDPARVAATQVVDVSCEAPDYELLLVDWLNALVYEMATRHLCFGRFEVEIDGNTLRGRAWGEPVDAAKHEPAVEVKGATYTALSVAEQPDGRWLAQCVIDV
jgi:tRNA nucleotidyltransferase (CCA-adding enzyme)